MEVILGTRDYEKTATGKYPKYNLEQMDLYVDPEYPSYTEISEVLNIISFDMFGKYKNELTKEETALFDEEVKRHYGIHNVACDLADYVNFHWDTETKQWIAI